MGADSHTVVLALCDEDSMRPADFFSKKDKKGGKSDVKVSETSKACRGTEAYLVACRPRILSCANLPKRPRRKAALLGPRMDCSMPVVFVCLRLFIFCSSVRWFKEVESKKGAGKQDDGGFQEWFHGIISRKESEVPALVPR